ncbi:Rhodanese-like domain [Cinara cedri]|uniref:Rhodanese-like domain n=1 Tax=Cinara cedri TaxID=506608 RepID=A0A5E4NBT0_9HEMI|nr:Rhodanese-like domain [Cinara cedri]
MCAYYEHVDYEYLVEKIGKNTFVIDVREEHEIIATGSIPNSINIPLSHLERELSLPDHVFMEKYKVRKPHKHHDEIVFSCARGNRSQHAAEIAHKLEFKKLFNFKGGWAEWSSKHHC